MSTAEPATEPAKKGENGAIPFLLAVIGSVAGTLVTGAFSSSQNLALAGAALGAAIPPLLAVAGPFTRLRLWGGVLIAVIALALTYGGFTVRDKALGVADTTFPVPEANSAGTEGTETETTKTATPSPSPSGATCEGNLCIGWSPLELNCSSDPCEPDVTVRSEGTDVLRVIGLKFTGDAADRLWQESTCEGESLDHDASCSITVRVKPGDSGSAQLRIQQNLEGPASLVEIEVGELAPPDSPDPNADLDLSLFTLPECSVVPGGSPSGADNLTIFVAVRNSGPAELSQLVPFKLTSDTGLSGGGNAAVSSGSSFTAMQVDLGPDDFGQSHNFTVTVDPNGEIAEQDESNNSVGVTISLPSRPDQAQDVPCATA